MEDFSIIAIKGKRIYLGASQEKENTFIWTKDPDEAIWFDTDYKAEEFAKQYFKAFKKWEIKPLRYNIDADLITI